MVAHVRRAAFWPIRGILGDEIVLPSWGSGGSCPPLYSAAGGRRRAAARAFAALLWPALCAVERRLGRFREELIKQSPNAIDLYEASLETARLAQAPDEIPFVDYLRSLFAGRDLNLVVAMGAPAARFVQRYRTEVFASTPLLITGADQRFVSTAALTWNDAAVATTLDLSKLIENVFQLLPGHQQYRLCHWQFAAGAILG